MNGTEANGSASQDLRTHAWEYFELHSNQRMASVNYHLVVASILTAGMIAAFSADVEMPLVAAATGVILVAASILFWRLDCRNRDLIKTSEEALIEWENTTLPSGSTGRLFARSAEADRHRVKGLIPVSYYECFRALFFLFALLGALGFFAGLWAWSQVPRT